jgi:SAM-dependent methyltransferase
MADGSAKRSGSQAAYKTDEMVQRYLRRQSVWHRLLQPPLPLLANPHESHLRAAQGAKLFIGGAGRAIRPGFLNLDLVYFPGVDVVADVECLPFKSESIVAIGCDAVLEHVQHPLNAAIEFYRVLRPGGLLHVVVPLCHPFHEYPRDYRRWTLDGLRELLSQFEMMDLGLERDLLPHY